MTNLDSILKGRDITLPTKVHLAKAMVFPVVMYGCESWTIKKAEHQRINAFELWCWRRLLRVPWTARRSNQSILKEIRTGCSLEGLMLKLKLQYFGHLMWRADSFKKTLMLGKIEGRRRRGWQRMRWLGGISTLMDMGLGGLRELVVDREVWRAVVHGVGHDWATEQNWTVYSCHLFLIFSASVRSLPFLSFIVPIFARNIPLVSPIILMRSVVFPILLSSSISLHISLKQVLLTSTCYSLVFCTQLGISCPFSLAFHLLSFLNYL